MDRREALKATTLFLGYSLTAGAATAFDELARVPHPIWGDRTRGIIAGLVADHWDRQA